MNPEHHQPAIEMSGVTAGSMRDQSLAVVTGINWTVPAGEFWVVAGPQRAGKSDFLMMTGGLMAPLEGTYQLFGLEMPIFDDERLPDRLKVGIVFDGGQLINRMTVSENILLPLRYHEGRHPKASATRLEALLKAVGLEAHADNRPTALGRSEQKQAGLARALALRPEVLLLDNPLSGAGPWHATWWLRFLGELSRGHELMDGKPLTIVVTADDLRPWREGSQQFASIVKGRFNVLGRWADVERCPDTTVQNLLQDRAEAEETAPAEEADVTSTES